MVTATATETEQPRAGWRFRLGLIVLVVGWLSPLCIPLITATELPTRWKTIISGALAVGIPEVFTVAAIAIMGKSGYNLIKERIFSFLKKHGPPDRVSLTRYRIGLVMFILPLIFGWLGPYGAHLIPGYETHRFVVSLIGDVMFVASLVVLGGDFWDKIRALFVYDVRVQIFDSKPDLRRHS
jgi:small basic protein